MLTHAGVLDSADAEQMTADKFCQITGLTDRRHRQIAKAGFFPMPKHYPKAEGRPKKNATPARVALVC